ncbi:MAG: Holliday junction branch migration protein RuvA [Spirulina sp. SIO3F2]|nr:Holliday junction branch migration protein RuvA [Spirulina sp. SIO3F2]
MISYLKGYPVSIWQRGNNRTLLTLEVQQVGYEVQVPARWANSIVPSTQEQLQVFTHQQVKDDQLVLYGFATAAERDLFRQLIAVSGIGAQMAIALLDTLPLTDLVQTIVSGNVRRLTQTPGVGKKTAERIILELKAKLSEWRRATNLPEQSLGVAMQLQEEIELTLLAIGYSQQEIQQALSVLSQNPQLQQQTNPEDWIREAIAWLSQQYP